MLICNTRFLNEYQEVIPHQDIRIEGTYIQTITDHGILSPYAQEEVINGEHLLIMPGLIDAHIHTGQQLLKGKVLDAKGLIWKEIMLPFESSLTPEIMQLNAQLSALEMIKSGTTSFIDAGGYHMDVAADIYSQSGLRGAISYSSMDDDPSLPIQIRDDLSTVIHKTDTLYDQYHNKGNLKVFYSLRTLMSVSKDLITTAHQHAIERNTMLQAHMNEYPKEVEHVCQKTGMLPYLYLNELGVLDEHFIGAHSLLLSEEELQLIKEKQSSVVVCPFSNCAKAVSPLPRLLSEQICVGLGSDGAAHSGLSLWNEMRNLRCMMNITHGIKNHNTRILPAKTLLDMATSQGAHLLQEPKLGKIKEGYLADLIAIDMMQPHLFPSHNDTNTLVECVNANDVVHSMVHGSWLMRDRQVLTLDEKAILAQAQQYIEKRR